LSIVAEKEVRLPDGNRRIQYKMRDFVLTNHAEGIVTLTSTSQVEVLKISFEPMEHFGDEVLQAMPTSNFSKSNTV
jgi:hypothetical protein